MKKFCFKLGMPLSQGKKENTLQIQGRIALLKEIRGHQGFKYPVKLLSQLLKKRVNGKLSDKEVGALLKEGRRALYQIDEFDKSELFAFNIFSNADRMKSDEFLQQQLTTYQEAIFGYKIPLKQVRGYAKDLVKILEDHSIPRIRAKLAFKEMIYVLTLDESIIFELISITPKYLSCPVIHYKVRKASYNYKYGDTKKQRDGKRFIDTLSKAMLGDRRGKKRRYPYWWLDYYYGEVTECIKSYAQMRKMQKSDPEKYLEVFSIVWAIPEIYQNLISENPRAFKQLTLQIMVANDMIPDEGTFNNCIVPRVKQLKKLYPYLRACDPVLQKMLDLPSGEPALVERSDLWRWVDDFNLIKWLKYSTELDKVP